MHDIDSFHRRQATVTVLHERFKTMPPDCKNNFMLNLAEHNIIHAYRYKKVARNSAFSGSDMHRMLFFLLTNVKMPTTVGILTFMSKKKIHAQLS